MSTIGGSGGYSFARVDRWRGAWGQVLEDFGWGPFETRSRSLLRTPAVELKAYGGTGPVLLLVPAPIKRDYIWDLVPGRSVVAHALASGCRVFLLAWQAPDDDTRGLADYGDRLIADCRDAIAAETGSRRLFLAGHSLGGILAAIFASLHPEDVQGLVLLAAPLDFAAGADVFAPLVAGLRWQPLPSGRVPGSLLNAIALAAAPLTIGCAPWLDRLASGLDPEDRDTLRRVERWTLDEMPLPGQLFADVVQGLYRDNAFMRGTLRLAGRRAASENVVAPVLSVVDPRCALVPPQSVLPFHRAIAGADASLLYYRGDTGVLLQHVGMLVGRSAHEHLWPEIWRWIHARR